MVTKIKEFKSFNIFSTKENLKSEIKRFSLFQLFNLIISPVNSFMIMWTVYYFQKLELSNKGFLGFLLGFIIVMEMIYPLFIFLILYISKKDLVNLTKEQIDKKYNEYMFMFILNTITYGIIFINTFMYILYK